MLRIHSLQQELVAEERKGFALDQDLLRMKKEASKETVSSYESSETDTETESESRAVALEKDLLRVKKEKVTEAASSQ